MTDSPIEIAVLMAQDRPAITVWREHHAPTFVSRAKVFAGSFRSFRKRSANQGAALQNLVSIHSRISRNFRYLF
jgi:hypothetical protein